MSQNNDIKTMGYVLRRTNYGEADRILNLITQIGKISVIAKGVRKEKSKLAGGIEMFTLSTYNIHIGKNDMGLLTGVKMEKYFGNIIKDYKKMELAALLLKKINKAAEGSASESFFSIIHQSLGAINAGVNLMLVEAWFNINLAKVMGEEINLYRDSSGNVLKANCKYRWSISEMVFCLDENGEYGENEIKLLRMMAASNLNVIRRVKIDEVILFKAMKVAGVANSDYR